MIRRIANKIYPRRIWLMFIIPLIMFCFYPLNQVQASSVGLSVAPQKFNLTVLTGDSYQGSFKLKNQSNISLPVSVRTIPFGAEEGTGKMRFKEPDPRSPDSWINLKTSELILKPGENRRLDFQVNVPDNTEPGGYYVFAYFKPRIPSYQLQKRGPEVIPVVGVPFLISTTPLTLNQEKSKDFQVVKLSIPKKERVLFLENAIKKVKKSFAYLGKNVALAATGGGQRNIGAQIVNTKPSKFTINIKNNDIYHIKPEGTLSIYNTFGDKVGEAKLPGETILPGKSRDFTVMLDETESNDPSALSGYLSNIFSVGKYRAELDIKADSPVRKEILPERGNPSLIFFSLTPFYLLVIFVTILLILYWGRKRIKSSFRILIKNKM